MTKHFCTGPGPYPALPYCNLFSIPWTGKASPERLQQGKHVGASAKAVDAVEKQRKEAEAEQEQGGVRQAGRQSGRQAGSHLNNRLVDAGGT